MQLLKSLARSGARLSDAAFKILVGIPDSPGLLALSSFKINFSTIVDVVGTNENFDVDNFSTTFNFLKTSAINVLESS